MPNRLGRLPLLLLLLVVLQLGYNAWQSAHRAPAPTQTAAPDAPAPTDSAPPADDAPVAAADTACARNLYQGGQPGLPARMQQGAITVCYPGYASASSPVTRTPLWSAEHLTARRITLARQTERVSAFYPEPSLGWDVRGELADYRRSGFDRGHLSPSGDMPGREVQRQSFSLANIAPQASQLNRGPWADLETRVRDLAQQAGEVWVVTGVLFEGARVNTTPDGRVMVPTSFWKAVAVPGRGAVVFLAANTDSGDIVKLSLGDFTRRTGITPFPRLSGGAALAELEMD